MASKKRKKTGFFTYICELEQVKHAMSQMSLSARAFHRVPEVSRTIADLAGDKAIQPAHLTEALQYRLRQR